MRLEFDWFYLKSRSLLLVYVGAISDSYTDYFLSRCHSKSTTELATMCKHKLKTQFSGFAGVCGFLRAFCGFLRDVCGAFWSWFCVFCRFCAKVLCTEKVGGVAESDLHTQLQCTTLAASKIATYMRGRREENMMKQTFKIIQFPWFLGVSVFDDDPQKTRRFRP